jgi:hypothetical protein
MHSAKRKKDANIVGLFVLAVFVMAISFTKGIEFLQNKKNVEATKNTLNDLGIAFSQDNPDSMRTWSIGECQDSWGSDIILNSKDKVISFSSKGPDKELGTVDDLIGDSYALKSREEKIEEMKVSAEPIVAIEDETPKKSFLSRFKFTWGKK